MTPTTLTSPHPEAPPRVSTIIHLVQNVSRIGGISGRVRNTLAAAKGRAVRHVCLAVEGDTDDLPPDTIAAADEGAVIAFLDECRITDTVVITPNNTLKMFPSMIRDRLSRFPIIHMASGQLSFIVQDTSVLANLKYVDSYRASRILCLSEMDMDFHRQLGIYELTKIKLPVQTRSEYSYDPAANRFVTYVGRIDFHAKGADRLVSIANLMKRRNLPPLRIYTTDGPNSPDLPPFLAMLAEAELTDWVQINYNVTDKQVLYGEASVLLLPSKKESFGNVILEAFSFGVPVIAAGYAPGPAEIIRSGMDGFLLDDFSDETVVSLLEGMSTGQLSSLSRNAFARHTDFSMVQYLASLEGIANDVLAKFSGRNEVRVFPRLRGAAVNSHKLKLAEKRIRQLESSFSWRITKPLRWLASKLLRRSTGVLS